MLEIAQRPTQYLIDIYKIIIRPIGIIMTQLEMEVISNVNIYIFEKLNTF